MKKSPFRPLPVANCCMALNVPDATTLKFAVLAFLDYMPCLELPVSAAEQYAKLRATQKPTGRLLRYMDTPIARHALAENLILLTNNERDFCTYSRIDH
ncbi:MAG: type II toxin-antitoxin system VapC family toxin [Propionivibrio sp.]|uniref:Type II toxin-antitoxin system VapC family toxin n=1 Tax=Candidatus Propionivibrio dominans TaxID=2954373 RepID=A0A9D7FBD9_9RHOO|nr:type II toxin-antitoxin system VapC family toxin [Candidatus Propionivibrio dominans]